MINPMDVRAACADIANALHSCNDSPYQFMDMVGGQGWSKIGEGAYSTALGKDNLVLKVNRVWDNADAYATWCMFNRGLPGVPDVYKVERLNGWYVVLMQRYRSINVYADLDSVKEVSRLNSVFKMFDPPRTPLEETAALIRDFFVDAGWDLHPGNVMVGQFGLVITDPFFRSSVDAQGTAHRCSSRRTPPPPPPPVYPDYAAIEARALAVAQIDMRRMEDRMFEQAVRGIRPNLVPNEAVRPFEWDQRRQRALATPDKPGKPHMAFIEAEEARKRRPGRGMVGRFI